MICDKCGSQVAEQKDPQCMYRVEGGKTISKLWHPDVIPEGWHDSPKGAQAAATEDAELAVLMASEQSKDAIPKMGKKK